MKRFAFSAVALFCVALIALPVMALAWSPGVDLVAAAAIAGGAALFGGVLHGIGAMQRSARPQSPKPMARSTGLMIGKFFRMENSTGAVHRPVITSRWRLCGSI